MAGKMTVRTLSDDDILTTSKVRRRRLLSFVGKGAIGAVAAAALSPTRGRAADSDLAGHKDDFAGRLIAADADVGANADTIGKIDASPNPAGSAVDADTGANADPPAFNSDPADRDIWWNADPADAD